MSNFSSLPAEKRMSMQLVNEKWSDENYSEDITASNDWKSKAMAKLREGDVRGMRQVALPSVQFKLLELAHEAQNESTQLSAAQTILAQEGHGPIQRVESSINVKQMSDEQLSSLLESKLTYIANQTGVDVETILMRVKENKSLAAPSVSSPEEIVDAEFESVPVQSPYLQSDQNEDSK